MKQPEHDALSSGMNLNDILFILFRHKKKILLCTALGLAAAAAVFFLHKPLYQSDAKLMVKYLVERSGIDSVDSKRGAAASSPYDDIISSEIEIITSWDLAMEVAEVVSAENAPDGAKAQAPALAAQILGNLTVAPRKGSNVIAISYKDPNPAQAHRILQELVKRYFDKHLQVHRSANSLELNSKVDMAGAKLKETEDELKRQKMESGIISLTDSTSSISAAIARSQEEYHAAETQLREQSARVEALQAALIGSAPKALETAAPKATPREVQNYRTLSDQLTGLRQSELQMLAKYSAQSRFVQVIQEQIKDLESRRRELERKYPELLAAGAQTGGGYGQVDLLAESAKLKAFEARASSLKERMEGYQEQGRKYSSIAPQIAQLERRKDLQETNYKYFESNLEKAKVDEALASDASKIPNISPVQKPSPPSMVTGKKNKIMLGLAGGGLALGLALAFIIEWILDRTIKRPYEMESRIGIPLLMSIPYLNGKKQHGLAGRAALRLKNRDGADLVPAGAKDSPAAWDTSHFIRKYCESIRDRLIVSFEIRNLRHKPKLVAVAGVAKGGGTSTVAAGLAAALSETGEGKVLLVDMNVGEGEVHPFFDGRPSASLASILQGDGQKHTPTAGNLYLATVNPPENRHVPIGLRRFYSLMPTIKATDFDYVIFDMPPLGATSPTLGMAGFMDKVLLVVEAERASGESVRRNHAELLESKADVSYVLNKVHSYTPKWVEGEN